MSLEFDSCRNCLALAHIQAAVCIRLGNVHSFIELAWQEGAQEQIFSAADQTAGLACRVGSACYSRLLHDQLLT